MRQENGMMMGIEGEVGVVIFGLERRVEVEESKERPLR